MRATPIGPLLGLLVTSVACVSCTGGQSGTEGEKGIACDVVETRALAPDEVTTHGTAEEMASRVSAAASLSLRWYGHGRGSGFQDTQVTLTAAPAVASARLVRRRQTDCPANAKCVGCPDLLEMNAVLAFETADGAFAETFSGTLSLEQAFGTMTFVATLPAGDLQGTYDASAILPNFRNAEYSVRVGWAPGDELQPDAGVSALTGGLFLSGDDADSDPSTVPTSAAIAEFPAP
ncbi:MAG: hypothetical protein FJ104_04060 [Deltaproteobacteria bacterium]|nr:hypothetical protein [Deltaproteobacteria bacterium]